MKLADMTIGTDVAWKTHWRGFRERLRVTGFSEVHMDQHPQRAGPVPAGARRVDLVVLDEAGQPTSRTYTNERPAAFIPWAVRQAEIDHADARKQHGEEQVELATKALDRLGVPAQVFPTRNGVTVHLNPDAVHELARAALLTD